MPRKLASALKITTAFLAVVALLWLLLIAAPMALTRWRMSKLQAEYHSLYPTQSNWADAQKLMARWGKWGHYEGTCTEKNCEYRIRVGDPYNNWVQKLSSTNQNRFFIAHVLGRLQPIGYRWSSMNIAFDVQDGRIIHTFTAMMIDVSDSGPPEHWSYPMAVSAKAQTRLANQTLNGKEVSPWVLGHAEQLAWHPDYIVGRPAACSICESVEITYTPTLPHEEAMHLTDFNLSCLTQLHECRTIGDLLPYGKDWHLYERDLPSNLIPSSAAGPLPCTTIPRALARDAAVVLEVEVLDALPSFKPDLDDDQRRELSRVRILNVWKNPIPDHKGTTILVTPFAGSKEETGFWPADAAEHLLPGHSAFLFLKENGAEHFGDTSDKPGLIAYDLDRCGVIDDTPANLAAIQLGLSQDILYRQSLNKTRWW